MTATSGRMSLKAALVDNTKQDKEKKMTEEQRHTQWYLCEIQRYPDHEGENLKKTDNLSVRYPDFFVGGISAILLGDDATDLKL
jgi:hypothetical protein